MTAIRDRHSDPDADEVAVRWDVRPIAGDRRGLPWWGAVLLAFGLAVVGATIDMQTQNALGWVFKICYFLGAIAAVCAVQRRSLFGPMVQPPLVLAISVPGVVLLISGLPANSDTLAKALAVGTPLINGFPTMAITTGLTLIIGIVRLYRERDPNGRAIASNSNRPANKKRSANQARSRDDAAQRGAGRPGREAAALEGDALREGPSGRGRGSATGRLPARTAAAGSEHPSLPLTPRRPRPDDQTPLRGGPRARRTGPRTPDGDSAAERGEAVRGERGRGGDTAGRIARDERGRRGGRDERAGGVGRTDPGTRGRGRAGRDGGSADRGEPGARGGDAAGRAEEPTRGGKTPPGRRFRQPRGATPEDDPRRGQARSDGAPDGPRRTPPRSGEPRGGAQEQGDPRRAPRRRGGPPPRGRRPWDDEG